MSIIELAQNLELGAHGIWISSKTESVSYPKDGHSRCFETENDSFWFQHRNDCIVATIKRFPPSGAMLEVGGGNGYVARRILDEGFECALLEPGPIGALNAKKYRKIPEVICSTLEAAQFEPGKLAAVGVFDVLEHIEDDSLMVSTIYDLLQPGGLVYCTVPAHQWLWSKHDVTAGHFRRYDRDSIKNLFLGQFELLYFSYFFAALTLPIFFLKALPFRLFKGRSILSQKAEHGAEGGRLISMLKILLERETGKITGGASLPTGTSCLIVARKVTSQPTKHFDKLKTVLSL